MICMEARQLFWAKFHKLHHLVATRLKEGQEFFVLTNKDLKEENSTYEIYISCHHMTIKLQEGQNVPTVFELDGQYDEIFKNQTRIKAEDDDQLLDVFELVIDDLSEKRIKIKASTKE